MIRTCNNKINNTSGHAVRGLVATGKVANVKLRSAVQKIKNDGNNITQKLILRNNK